MHTKHINTLCGQNVEFFNVKPVGTYTNHWAWRLKKLCNDLNKNLWKPLDNLRGVIGHRRNLRTDTTARSTKEHSKSKFVNFLVFVNSLAFLFGKKKTVKFSWQISFWYIVRFNSWHIEHPHHNHKQLCKFDVILTVHRR